MKRSRTRSPMRSSENLKTYVDYDVLHIKNLPPLWNANSVKKFLVETCKSKSIIDGVKNIIILKSNEYSGSCLIKFFNSFPCNLALAELPGTICEGNQIDVSLDLKNLYQEENKNLRSETYKRGIGGGSRKSGSLSSGTYQQNTSNQQSQSSHKLSRSSLNDMSQQLDTTDEYETYGLSMNFLQALNIKPPLLNRIFIGNLDSSVTEAKLREVFSYAGQIMQVTLISKDKQRQVAKIEFDHPVEAVQAIAMFHSQELYDKPMLVQMDASRHQYNNTPKGLSGFGPGLGVNGIPLRGVRTHIELQPLKNLLTAEINKLKEKAANSSDIDDNQRANQTNQGQIDTNMINLLNSNALSSVNMSPLVQPNPLLNLTGLMNTQGLQNLQLLQSLFQQNTSAFNDNHNQTPFGSGQSQNVQNQLLQLQGKTQSMPHTGANVLSDWLTPASYSGVRQPDGSQQVKSRFDIPFKSDGGRISRFDDVRSNTDDRDNRNRGWWDQDNDGDKPQITTSDMLVFNNLPESVDMQVLNSKMREVGDIKFVEMTGRGRALVRFLHARDADRCMKLFHESKVDGKTIEVRFF